MPGTYPFYHNYTRPTDYVVCSTGTRRNFVFDADRVGSSTRILFGYTGGPVLETFTRKDGSFYVKTPDVGPYVSPSGTDDGVWVFQYDPWTITTQQAAPTSFDHTPSWTNTFTGLLSVRPTDIDISCVVKAASGRAGLFMRGDNNPSGGVNAYYLDIAAGFVKFATSLPNTGQGTVVFTGATPIVANTNYTLRLVAVGNNYTVYVNGVSEGTFSTAVTAGGFAGIWADTTSARFSTPFTIAKTSNPVATTYTVRNYDGDIVATGAVTDSYVDIPDSSLTWRGHGPYGWYRFYLTGPDHGDSQWGTAYGDCTFYRVRTDSGFYANAPNNYAPTDNTMTDEYARATIGGLGVPRFFVSSATTGTVAANNASAAVVAPFMKTNWVDTALSLRPRINIGEFADGTLGIDSTITATVNLLKTSIQGWEPRNEPDYGTNGEFYITNEFDAFRTAVRAADPTAKIIGPGTVTYNIVNLPFINAFLDSVMSRGGTAYLDGLSVHGYNCTNGDLSLARQTLTAFKAAVTAKGYTGPIYQTEQGFEWQHFAVVQPRHGGQWTALARFMEELYGIPHENNSYWYDVDHGFWDVPMWWLHPVGPGPQALPMRTMAAEIGNRSLTAQFDFGTYGNHLYAGGTWTASDGSNTVGFIAASTGQPDLRCSVTGAAELSTCDSWGNTYTVAATSGLATFTVGELPTWVRVPSGVSVTPLGLGLNTNLATAATVSATGDQNYLTRINDGLLQNPYGSTDVSWTSADAPYSDRSNTFPQTVTLTLSAPTTATRIIVHSMMGWQEQGTLTDFDVDTWDGSTWTTRYSQSPPATKTFLFTSVAKCLVETYWEPRHVWDISFTAATISKVRVVVRACSYGEFETSYVRTQIYGGTLTQYLAIREIQVFNVTASQQSLPPRLRNPAMGGVTG